MPRKPLSSKMGRPKKFSSPEEMQEVIDKYFDSISKTGENNIKEWLRPPTIEGIALALGTSRQTLLEYETLEGFEEFFDTVKKAKAVVGQYVAEQLMTSAPTGAIFNLKNNFGYEERLKSDIGAQEGQEEFLLGLLGRAQDE